MSWLSQLHAANPVAHALGILALVCMAGMALGSLKFRGLSLGTAGVLFSGILTGYFGKPIDAGTLDFVKEFGLILFVFAIGLQLGPGFFSTLRKQGIRLNALAATVVLLGAVFAPLVGWAAGFDAAAVLGLFSGSSVNMPSLGAATQTLDTLSGIAADRRALPALACAVTFPVGVVGSIATLLILKRAFRVDTTREAAAYAAESRSHVEPLERRTLVVSNPQLSGARLDAIPGRIEAGVTISRVRHNGDTRVATSDTKIETGDRLAVVGTAGGLNAFERVVGPPVEEDLVVSGSSVTFRRVLVTNRAVLGKTVGELNLNDLFGVAVTRVTRADMEMTAVPGLRLQFGDTVQIVGSEADLGKAAAALGNSLKELNETHFIPLFIGIFTGIVVGTLPIAMPGLPQPVRLGLAGGPLIVALILGRFGRIGPLVCHMPPSANLAFRDFGIALFFAAVGLSSGAQFFSTVFSSTGLQWVLAGFVVTMLPLLIVGAFARRFLKMGFLELTGLLAGSTTNPPALTFATTMAGSDAPAVTYSAVYPLTMVLRVLTAQILTLTMMQ
jgi:putative transport protein